jgi:acetyl-CoA carboxylase biotin carboxylase subunit
VTTGKHQHRFKRVLIANRGEIAVRVAHTLREMGIEPVAVYSDVDRMAPHVRVCDHAYYVGPAPARESYLVTQTILDVAKKAGVDAIHPGYGFLSENAGFAEAVKEAGIVFIGPPPEAMRVMGSKTGAREAMMRAGVPCVPGSEGKVKDGEEARRIADAMGYPVMLKASAGGGGKGMRLVHRSEDMVGAFRSAASEAQNAFNDPSVYIEKAILNPRHIEIQVFSGPDSRTVFLGERECSMQRRHQKVIEETPSAIVDEDMRRKMGAVACKAAEAVGYVGAGTVEFLVDEQKNFYFLEMNTRLQVEHPVTELCYGVDLVQAQVRVAEGEPLRWKQEDIAPNGHAIEARIYAEDPDRNFMPCPGDIVDLVLPQGPGVRVDCGVAAGFQVPRYYDPMIAKIAVWGEDRERARRRLHRALGETAVKGITTNTSFLRRLLESKAFIEGQYHTGTIDALMKEPPRSLPSELVDVAVAAAVIDAYQRDHKMGQKPHVAETSKMTSWRSGPSRWRGG